MADNAKPKKNYPDSPRLAVGAIVFREGRVLLVKRGNAPAKGMWAIPGGGVKLGETLKQAAEREIYEETGLSIKAGEPVYSFEVIDHDESGKIRFHYYVVDLEGEYAGGEIEPGDDAADAAWFSVEDLKHHEVNPRTLELLSQRYDFG